MPSAAHQGKHLISVTATVFIIIIMKVPSTLLGTQEMPSGCSFPFLPHTPKPHRAQPPLWHLQPCEEEVCGRKWESRGCFSPGNLTGLALFSGTVSCSIKSFIIPCAKFFQVTPQKLVTPSWIFLKETESHVHGLLLST